MTPQQQVDQQLNQDFEKFYNSIYEGEVPENIVELFKSGIIQLHPFSHKINFHKVKAISGKKANELMVGDVSEVVKVILNTPLGKLYGYYEGFDMTFEQVIDMHIVIEKFIIHFNKYVDEFKGKLELKRANLLQLSGARNGNAMKIIQA